MSDIVLRGLLLPENNKYQTSSTSNTNNNSVLKSLQIDQAENQGAQSLSLVDSLKLSENTSGSSKGSVPIQLMSPNDINVQSTPAKQSSGNTKFNALMNLKPITKPSRQSTQGQQPRLNGLSNTNSSTKYNVTSTTTYSQTTNGTKVSGSYSTTMTGNVSTVSNKDKVSDKINAAIEKIQTWDRKIGILDSELQKQKSGSNDPSRLISRTSQMVTAKKDAVVSREDALKAYTDVMKEINSQFGSASSSSFGQYKNSYLKMESMFAAANERDKGMMDKTMDFLKGTMTTENFNRALTYLNPFN